VDLTQQKVRFSVTSSSEAVVKGRERNRTEMKADRRPYLLSCELADQVVLWLGGSLFHQIGKVSEEFAVCVGGL
jgi:hypothetical protein